MTATVTISGTWSEKARPNNGLNSHAELIRRNRVLRVPIVAFVEYHQWTETLTGEKLTVAIPVIEPCFEADGTDPAGLGKQVMDLLDQLRKQRGKGSVDDVPSGPAQLEGQESLFDFDDPDEADDEPAETNASGDPVPPPSGEEIVAELDERRKAKKVPAAKFEGGDK